MQLARVFLQGFAFLLVLPALSRAEMEFRGLISDGSASQFSLTDSDTGQTAWKKVGGTFAGFTIVSFDPASETLKLKNEAGELKLKFKDSTIRTSEGNGAISMIAVPPELAERGITAMDIIVRLDQKEKVVIYLSPGVLTQPVKKRYVRVSVGTENGNFDISTKDTTPLAPVTREDVPEDSRSFVTDADIAVINRHLASVLPKWLPERKP